MENSNQTPQAQQVQGQMPSVNGSSPSKSKVIPIVLGIAAVVVIAIGAYILGAKQSQPVVQNSIQTTPIPSPIPTIDETANWKTFKNTKFNYEFKYPPRWILQRGPGEPTDEEIGKGILVDIYDPNVSTPGMGFSINTNELHKTGLSRQCEILEDCVNKVTSYFPKEVVTESETFLGKGATRITYNYTNQLYSQTLSHLFIIINEDFYNFKMSAAADVYDKNKHIFDQILSTFKFTDQNQTLDTVSWKTYINDGYGFEFRYPKDSKISNDRSSIELPFNSGTNLTGKTLWITVKTSTPADCSNPPTQVREKPTTIRINNIEFKKEIGGDVGAGQIHDEFNYSTSKGSNCFRFSFVLDSGRSENFSPPRPEFDKEKEIQVFDQILSTFRFSN